MSSSSEDGTDREEPPPRQNLQAALQLLRRQPHRGTEGRSGENEEENDSPHHVSQALITTCVYCCMAAAGWLCPISGGRV